MTVKGTGNFQGSHEHWRPNQEQRSSAKTRGLILATLVLLQQFPVQSICPGIQDGWPCNCNQVLTSDMCQENLKLMGSKTSGCPHNLWNYLF